MFVNVYHETRSEHARLFVFGVVFLVAMSLLIALSLAIYNKAFEDSVDVTIKADRAGLQLAQNGDVRLHGALVGRVAAVEQDGEEASIDLALKPDAAERIALNSTVDIVPTTLFGQKFVEFSDPEGGRQRALRDGDVIPSRRVSTNVELQRILAELFPLLRSVNPAELNTTLSALATALNGRGERIGRLMVDLEGYVGRLNERLPTLRRDLELLADVASTYQLSAQDILRLMRNATVSARTLVEEEQQLKSFLGDITGMATVTTRVLRENEDGIIRLGQSSEPFLRLMATYSPEYPCLLKGLDRYTEHLSQIFADGRVAQLMEMDAVQRPVYKMQDLPEYAETGHGPWCLGLPNPPVPAPPVSLKDGSNSEDVYGRGGGGLPRVAPRAFTNPTSGYAGTPAEQRLVSTVLAAESGRSVHGYSSVSALLYGPQLRGTQVRR